MITYYAAMGKYRLEQFDGESRPVVLIAGNEYGVTIPEYILWNALLWNILNYDACKKRSGFISQWQRLTLTGSWNGCFSVGSSERGRALPERPHYRSFSVRSA